MAPTGFSPADTVLALSGAAWGAQLHALFWRYGVYAVAVLVGLVAAAWRAAQSGRLLPVATYVLLSGGAFVALGTSPSRLTPQPPLSVQMGATAEAGAPVPEPQGSAGLPAGFLLLNGAIESVARTLISVVKSDFAERPFLTVVAMNALAGDRMDDTPALQGAVRDFIRTCYAEALALWKSEQREADIAAMQSGGRPPRTEAQLNQELAAFNTPAHPTVVALYDRPALNTGGRSCRTDWQAIRTGLTARYADTAVDRAIFYVASRLPGPTADSLKDWAANRTLQNLVTDYEAPGGSAGPIQWSWWNPGTWVASGVSLGLSAVAGFFFQFILDQFVRFMSAAIYPLYGMIQMLVYATFPIALALAMLPGQLYRLQTYLLTLLSIKLWPAFWAAINAAHDLLLPSIVRLDRAQVTYLAIYDAVTMMAVAMVPSLATAIVGSRMFSGLHLPTPGVPTMHPVAGAGLATRAIGQYQQ